MLERRLLLSVTVEYREFPFSLFGMYTGKNPGTYISSSSNTKVPYLDQFHGSLAGRGSVKYDSNTQGRGAITLGRSPGEGHDNFWKHYEYDVVGTLLVQDSDGILEGGPGPNAKRVLDEHSIELFNPPTRGYGIKPLNPGAIPQDLSGEWSSEDYLVSLYGKGPFDFHGSVSPLITSPIDIAIDRNTLRVGYDCVCLDVTITGAFPREPETKHLGSVKAEWLDGFDTPIATVLDEPVYWNTGRVSLKTPANAPVHAVRLQVTATTAGDSDVVVVDYTPDFLITSFTWGTPDGVTGSYRIDGGDRAGVPIQLYWSEDDKYGGNDTPAGFSFTTQLSGSGDVPFPRIPASTIIPPGDNHAYLLAVIDDQDEFKECNEENNVKALFFYPYLTASLEASKHNVRRRTELYEVDYSVKNWSHLQVYVDITRSRISDVLENTVPVPITETVLLQPGSVWTASAAFAHDWDWVVKQDPIYQPDAIFTWTNAISEDLLSFLVPPATVYVKLYDVALYLHQVKAGIFSIPNQPYANIQQILATKPRVRNGDFKLTSESVQAYVGSDKELALKAYQTFALTVASTLLGINLKVPLVGSIVSAAIGELIDQLSKAAGLWQAVYDPPDPQFRTFSLVERLEIDLSNIPSGPLREQARQRAIVSHLSSAMLRAIDKKDGAVLAADSLWQSQQLVDLVALSNQQFFEHLRVAGFDSFLETWERSQSATPENAVEYWQNHGLPADLVVGLERLGLPQSFQDELLTTLRSMTVEDNQRYDPKLRVVSAKYEAVDRGIATLDFLQSAIGIRTRALGLVARQLTPAEELLLASYRELVTTRRNARDYGPDVDLVLQEYLGEVTRLALLTNNFAAVEPDFHLVFLAGVESAGEAVNLAGFIDEVNQQSAAGFISATFRSVLTTQADLVRSLISNGDWSELTIQLATLRSQIVAGTAADISEPTRTKLLHRVEALIEVNGLTPTFSVPTMGGIPGQLTLESPLSPVLGNSVSVSQENLGSFVGGQISLTLSSPRSGSQWIFGDAPIFPLVADDELSLDGVPVADVVNSNAGNLVLKLLADATPERVQQLLRMLKLEVPISSQDWTSQLDVELRNGVGGSTVSSVSRTRPSGTPPGSENHAPTEVRLSNSSVPENLPGHIVVGAFLVTDEDPNDTFTFSLASGDGATDNGRFTIVGNQLRTAETLNFERQSSYSVRVRATDRAGASAEQALVVSALNAPEAPNTIELSLNSVLENRPAGTFIGTLVASDEDGDAPVFSYSFVNVPGSADNVHFTISDDMLFTASSFDFETKRDYSLLIRATDVTGRFVNQWIQVVVSDINEAPADILLSHQSVPEDSPVNTVVGTFSGLDADASRAFRYELVAGPGSADNTQFKLDGDWLLTTDVFDHESRATRSIRVRMTDAGGLTVEKVFVIGIENANDVPLGVTLSNTVLEARLPGGITVGVLGAVDADVGETFTFDFAAGAGSQDNILFEIVGNQLRTREPFEFSPGSHYLVRIQAIDSGGASVHRAFRIEISPPSIAADVNLVSASQGPIAADSSWGSARHPQAVSDNGRYAVFTSRTSGLVADVNSGGFSQVYLSDRQTGALTLVSRNSVTGAAGDGDSRDPQVSADGSIITYFSGAKNVVENSTIVANSLYIYDVASGATRLISHLATNPLEGLEFDVEDAALALNGKSVVFATAAGDVVSGVFDENFSRLLYLYDVVSGENRLITHASHNNLVPADASTVEFRFSGNGLKVAFSSFASNLVSGVIDENFGSDVFVYDVVSDTIQLASFAFADRALTSNGSSFSPVISFDGTLVAYTSDSSDIVPVNETQATQVYVYNASTQSNRTVSHRAGSLEPANAGSQNPQISRDGSSIVYDSLATDLIAGYEGTAIQVYQYAVSTGANALVSHASTNATKGGDADSNFPTLSPDGSRILYSSMATDVRAGVVNPSGVPALYFSDIATNSTTLLTHSPDDPLRVPDYAGQLVYSFSGDGLTVVLESSAPLDSTVSMPVQMASAYLYNIAAGQHRTLAVIVSSNTARGSSTFSDMSADGRYVVFQSNAPNAIAGQLNTVEGIQVFLLDRQTGKVSLVSHAPDSPRTSVYGDAEQARISADGSTIVYVIRDLSSFQRDVWMYNTATGVNTLVSHAAGELTPANGDSHTPRVSDDGKRIVFESSATNLVPGQINNGPKGNVFAYEPENVQMSLVSHRSGNSLEPANSSSYVGEISGNGAKAVFTSYASDLVASSADDTNQETDVFVYDFASNSVELVSHISTSRVVAGNGASSSPSISRDGTRIAFESRSSNIMPGAGTDFGDVYWYDAATGDVRLVSHRADDPATSTDDGAEQPRISANGQRIVFRGFGDKIVNGFIGETRYGNIYVHDIPTNESILVSHIDWRLQVAVNYHSYRPSISGDGSTVVWMTWADDVLSYVTDWNSGIRDHFGFGDVYVYQVSDRRNTLLSRVHNLPNDAGNDDSTTGEFWDGQGRSVSDNGGVVVFDSIATDITAGDGNSARDLFAVAVSKLLPPHSITLLGDAVAENLPPAETVGRLQAVDSQSSNPLAFSLVPGDGDEDNARFKLSTDGTLTTRTSFNFEDRSTRRIRTRATNSAGFWSDAEFLVAVTDVNDPPVLHSPGNKTVSAGALLTFTVLASDEDIIAGAPEAVTYEFVTGNVSGMSLDPATGSFRWTPTSGDIGQVTVAFRAIDSRGTASAEQSVVITVTELNHPPVLLHPGDQTVDEQTALEFRLTASDDDITAGSPETLSYMFVSGHTTGMTLNSTTGAFSWTPAEVDDGQVTVVFRATDSHGAASSDQSVTITVKEVNEPPNLANPGNPSINEKTPLIFSIVATDLDQVAGTPDTVSYMFVSGHTTGMTLNSTTGAFSWTPGEAEDGQVTVVFRATDSHGDASSDQTVTITVKEVNDPPISLTLTNSTLKERLAGAVIGELLATDEDSGQTHVFTTADQRFEIVGTTLKLRVNEFLVRDESSTFSVDVTVTDSGVPAGTLTKSLSLAIERNPHPWQNPIQPLDTDGDRIIAPIDVLLVINLLNNPGSFLGAGGRLASSRPAVTTLPYYDPSGDNFCSAIDALLIVNNLNGADGEGERAVVGAVAENARRVVIGPPASNPNTTEVRTRSLATSQRPMIQTLQSPAPTLMEPSCYQPSLNRRHSSDDRNDLLSDQDSEEWERILELIAADVCA